MRHGECDTANTIQGRRNEMKKWILATVALAMLGDASAIASAQAQAMSPDAPRSARNAQQPSTSGGLPEAPVGHRQPTRGDGASETGRDNPGNIDAQDRQLDRMIKGICKGC
jgi:hypothetical protein